MLIGADLVDVREIGEALVTFGERYLSRVYTPDEILYATGAASETCRRLGARFAAKEATIKALRAADAGIGLRSIEVVKAPDGACELALSGNASAAAERAGAGEFTLTMSHQGHLAMAVVIAERANVYSTRPPGPSRDTRFGPSKGAAVMDEQIRSILKQHARLAIDVDQLRDDTDLYQAGMTSHASVNVMLALEGTFNTEFPDLMLRRGVFVSVAAIRAAVQELIKAG